MANPFVRVAMAACSGIGVAVILLTLLSVGAGYVLSKPRLEAVIAHALVNPPGLPPSNEDGDYVGECALLEMNLIGHDDPIRNAVASNLTMATALRYLHPCRTLHKLVFGERSPHPATKLDERYLYRQYLFGQRFLEAPFLAVMNYPKARQVYSALTYASVFALLIASLLRSPAAALVISPVIIYLLLGFGMTRLAPILSHAPGFMFGFFLLAWLVYAQNFFAPLARRAAFFTVLAAVATYFDMLNGPILILLTLAMVLNHLFYVMPRDEPPVSYLRSAVAESVLIFCCFLFAYVVLTALHLWLLAAMFGDDWRGYFASLGIRLSNQVAWVAEKVGPRDIIGRLWFRRFQLVPVGYGWLATTLLLSGGAAWLVALAAVASIRNARLTVDVMMLAGIACGTLFWLLILFPNHTYIHAALMVRCLTVPTALGFVALLLALRVRSVRGKRDSARADRALTRSASAPWHTGSSASRTSRRQTTPTSRPSRRAS